MNCQSYICNILLRNGKEIQALLNDQMLDMMISCVEDKQKDFVAIGTSFIYKEIIGIIDFKPYVEKKTDIVEEEKINHE